jgi:hypothetical protein
MIRRFVAIGVGIWLSHVTDGSQNPTSDYFHTFSNGRDSVEVSIQRSRFAPERHKITKVAGQTYVDGQKALGIDGSGQITDEITKFEIKWNGNRVPLPSAAYAQLFLTQGVILSRRTGRASRREIFSW